MLLHIKLPLLIYKSPLMTYKRVLTVLSGFPMKKQKLMPCRGTGILVYVEC